MSSATAHSFLGCALFFVDASQDLNPFDSTFSAAGKILPPECTSDLISLTEQSAQNAMPQVKSTKGFCNTLVGQINSKSPTSCIDYNIDNIRTQGKC